MADVSVIDWHVHPLQAERWYAAWLPAAERVLAFGADSHSLTRSEDDPLHFRQTSIWERREDFDRYWGSDEVTAARREIISLHSKLLLPTWHSLLVAE